MARPKGKGAFTGVPKDRRDALRADVYAGRTYEWIAEHYFLSESTVKRMLKILEDEEVMKMILDTSYVPHPRFAERIAEKGAYSRVLSKQVLFDKAVVMAKILRKEKRDRRRIEIRIIKIEQHLDDIKQQIDDL